MDDFIGGSFHAGWDFWMAVLPYLLDDANCDPSRYASLCTLNPLVERPSVFLPSLVLEKHCLVIGVYPLA